jgi:Flp pilus assembly protein TadG
MLRWLHHLRKDERGAALIELALVMPIMMTLFFGGFEVTRVINANTRVAAAAQSLADLVAQQSAVTATSVANFCKGGQLVMTPFPNASLKATIASVTRGGSGTTVDWQDTTCGTSTSISNATTLASPVIPNAGDSVIVVKTTYAYTSPFSYVLHASYTLTQTAFARPQMGSQVVHN